MAQSLAGSPAAVKERAAAHATALPPHTKHEADNAPATAGPTPCGITAGSDRQASRHSRKRMDSEEHEMVTLDRLLPFSGIDSAFQAGDPPLDE